VGGVVVVGGVGVLQKQLPLESYATVVP